jgi:metal-sulfur cluster biosynthetic enzyme
MTIHDRIREKCREVVDPCSAATGSNLDIVEMGLVKSINVTKEGHATIELRLTTPTCNMVAYFVEEIERYVSPLPEVTSVNIDPDNGLEWTEDMMSDKANRRRRTMLDKHAARYREETTMDRPSQ